MFWEEHMSANNPMIQGLANSLFANTQDRFEKEKSFGKKLYLTAWAVEMLAASIGLLIAWFMAFDAYNSAEEKNFTTGMNALLGALPFLLIAIIEPTKIPLAGGLYKIKHLGWKTLIFAALVGLTCVTFETLFTGLERQVTNVTAKISKGEDEIRGLEEINEERQVQKKSYESLSVVDETQDLNTAIKDNRDLEANEESGQMKSFQLSKNQFDQQILEAQKQKNEIISIRKNTRTTSLEPLQNSVNTLDEKIREKKEERQALTVQLNGATDGSDSDDRIKEYNTKISKIKDKLETFRGYVASGDKDGIGKIQVVLGVRNDGKFGYNTRSYFFPWMEKQEKKMADLEIQVNQRKTELGATAQSLESNVREKISQIDEKIEALESNISQTQSKITALGQNQNALKYDNTEIDDLDNLIKGVRQKISALIAAHNEKIEAIKAYRKVRQEDLEANKTTIQKAASEQINQIPELKKQISTTTKEINENKQDLRLIAQQNQIYRFAQKYGGHDDILEVTEKELTFVATIWFGSIALVCATVGTILALISYIMTDPEAFVQKQKLIIDNPLRRSMRRVMLALRRRLFVKPRRIEVPIEVEKIVEIEKIIEVEKIVEVIKEVIKEVPVEKVVIQEVPVEVVRRELVHVPFYATEAGVVDASERLKMLAPRLEDLPPEATNKYKKLVKKNKPAGDDQS